MKKFLVLLSFLGFLGLLLTPNSYAYSNHSWDAPPVEVTDPPQAIYFKDGPGSGAGGEFEIYSDAARTDIFHLFNSFCVERNEYIDFSSEFHVDAISEVAVAGGKGGGNDLLGGDPLDEMTAFLYHNFYWGTLDDYNYDGLTTTEFASRSDAATELQMAIWIIEQEWDWDGDLNYEEQVTQTDVDFINNFYLNLAWKAVNLDETWEGLGDVRVINLTGSANKQDQLTVAPVPEPATMLLFGTGLIGLAGLGRKKFFKKS